MIQNDSKTISHTEYWNSWNRYPLLLDQPPSTFVLSPILENRDQNQPKGSVINWSVLGPAAWWCITQIIHDSLEWSANRPSINVNNTVYLNYRARPWNTLGSAPRSLIPDESRFPRVWYIYKAKPSIHGHTGLHTDPPPITNSPTPEFRNSEDHAFESYVSRVPVSSASNWRSHGATYDVDEQDDRRGSR